MTTFTYEVAGQEYEDTQAFGKGWEWAKDLAKKTGSEIWRTTNHNGKERRGFLATGWVFLGEACYTPEKAFHY